MDPLFTFVVTPFYQAFLCKSLADLINLSAQLEHFVWQQVEIVVLFCKVIFLKREQHVNPYYAGR